MKLFRAKDSRTMVREGYLASYVADVNLAEDADSLGFIVVRIASGTSTSPHLHEKLSEIFVALSPLSMTLNEEYVELEYGDVIVAEPGEAHSFKATGNEGVLLAVKVPNLSDDKISISGPNA
jgi:quercetin dioxygenase-like cupin family protein